MSHITEISGVAITDLVALERALATLGLELVRNQTTFRWHGRSVGDTALPAGFTVADLGKCEHAIRVKNAAAGRQPYEIGLVLRRDGQPGYAMLYDSWQGGFGLEAKAGAGLRNVLQAYSLEGVRKLYGRTHKITSTPGADGKLRVHLEG